MNFSLHFHCLLFLVFILATGCASGAKYYRYDFSVEISPSAQSEEDTAVIDHEGLRLQIRPTQTGFDVFSENDSDDRYYIEWAESRYRGSAGVQQLIVKSGENEYHLAASHKPASEILDRFSFYLHAVGLKTVLLKEGSGDTPEIIESGHFPISDYGDEDFGNSIENLAGATIDLLIALRREDESKATSYLLRYYVRHLYQLEQDNIE